MADLKKILVHVPSNLCDGFKTKYVTGASGDRDKSYDGKIVFLEKTQEIFTKGKIYSTSVLDFSSLKELVGELPGGIDSTNIADYIGEVKGELLGTDDYDSSKDTIWGAKAYAGHIGGELIGDAISDTWSNNTIQGAKRYAEYVSSNVIEGTGIKVKEDITLDDNGGSKKTFTISNSGVTSVDKTPSAGVALTYTNGKVGVNVSTGEVKENNDKVITGGAVYTEVKKLIGNDNDAYTVNSIKGAKAYTAYAAYDVFWSLIGNWGNDSSYDTIYGAKAYTSKVFYDLIGINGDPSSYNTIYGAKKYADEVASKQSIVQGGTGISVAKDTYNGQATFTVSNSVGAGISTTSSNGVALYKDHSTSLVGVSVNPGAVSSTENKVVTGKVVYTAINSAKTDLIGKSSDASTANTIYGTKKYADEAASKVEAKILTLSAGNGIALEPSTLDGHPNIKISTSARVFYYQGNKTTVSALPSTGNKGDVWSVGTENAEGSTLYVWDGDEWINIGGPNGVTDVKTTASHGVALAKNQGGEVYVNVTPGEIKKDNDSVVTGGTAYTAIAAAESRCDAKGTAERLISYLDSSYESTNGDYINVKVDISDGKLSNVTVTERPDLLNAIDKANNSIQDIIISQSSESYLSTLKGGPFLNGNYMSYIGLNVDALSSYILHTKIATNAKTGTSDYVNVSVNTSGGNVSKVTVAETDNLKNAVNKANSAVQTITVNSYSGCLYTGKNITEVSVDLDDTLLFNYVSDNVWETYTE